MRRTSRSAPFFYIAPALLCVALIFLYPIVRVCQLSLYKVTGASKSFVGLGNYRTLLEDEIFRQAVQHNLLLLLTVPVLIALSLVLSSLLYEQMKGWRVYRSIVFLPYILPVPMIGVLFGYVFQYNGMLNSALRALGVGVFALDWLGNGNLALPTLMLVIVWKELGFGVVLFLARLLAVPVELFEAARLDGANWWQTLWHITIPQLRSVIEFYTVIAIITMLSWVFSYVYSMTAGGPANATTVMELYIYQQAIRFRQTGLASAVAVVLLLMVLVFVFLQFRVRGRTSLEHE
jgi:ABC-type sugar transport system permease subunit